jgi:hypothetical protein
MYACKRHYKTVVADTRRVFEMKPAYISKVLKTFTLEKMRDFCAEHAVNVADSVKTKSEFRAVVSDVFKTKYVYPVDQRDLYAPLLLPQAPPPPVEDNEDGLPESKKLTSSASTVSLVFVGYNLMKMFDALFYGNLQPHDGCLPAGYKIDTIDTVVIENQISPIANRMKTVQGMITQYFLMRGVDKRRIIYFSAVQKLKVAPYHFVFYNNQEAGNGALTDADAVDDIQTYDDRKKAGVACVRKILANVNAVSGDAYSPTPKLFSIVQSHAAGSNVDVDWLHVFESHSKKDDMADAFLQGLSYIVKTESKCESKNK